MAFKKMFRATAGKQFIKTLDKQSKDWCLLNVVNYQKINFLYLSMGSLMEPVNGHRNEASEWAP